MPLESVIGADLRPESWLGRVLEGPARAITVERLHWYAVSIGAAVAGQPVPPARNIHTDTEYARSQGWPDVIADGMITGNWIQSMLLDAFGGDYLREGELRVKFIRPILLGTLVRTTGRVVGATSTDGALALVLEVNCHADQDRDHPLAVGDARVTCRPSAKRNDHQTKEIHP